MAVQTQIIPIGNSQGVRIPKPLLEQAGLSGEVALEVQENRIIIQPAAAPVREGWEAAFSTMAEREDDALLDMPQRTSWDDEAWEWE